MGWLNKPDPKRYQPTNRPVPPGCDDPGTHYVPGGIVVDGVFYEMTPEYQEQIEDKKKSGRNGFGWKFGK